jgi:hypothetical protein
VQAWWWWWDERRERGWRRVSLITYGVTANKMAHGSVSGHMENGDNFFFKPISWGGSCGKVRALESSRARQLPCAEGVPGVRLNLLSL